MVIYQVNFFMQEVLYRKFPTGFFQNHLPFLPENISRLLMFRFSALAREYLYRIYRNRWIGRGGPKLWAPILPVLNTLNYNTPVQNFKEQINRGL